MSSCLRWPGLFVIVIILRTLLFAFGVCLDGPFEDPTFPVGMIGWFIRSAVDLTWTIEYAVQTRRARIVYFEWLFPLTGLRASESGIDGRFFGVIAIIAMLVSVASGLVVVVSGI